MKTKLKTTSAKSWSKHHTNHDISHTFHIQLFLRTLLAYCRSLVHILIWSIHCKLTIDNRLQAHFDCFRFNVTCKYPFQNFICYRFRHDFYFISFFFVFHFNIMRKDVSNYWMCALMRSDWFFLSKRKKCVRIHYYVIEKTKSCENHYGTEIFGIVFLTEMSNK